MKEAAEITGVSIPTVSEQIKRLETLLETQLFLRKPRRLELTPDGETLYRHAEQMFQSGLRFLDVVSTTSIGGYAVRIGAQESYAIGPALDFLVLYQEAFSPYGTLQTFRESNPDRLFERVFNGELDWAIALRPPTSPRLEFAKIGSTEIVLCTSQEKLDAFPDRSELIRSLPLARGRKDEQVNKLISDHLQAADIFIEETIDSDHLELSLRLAEKGECVTAIAKNLAGQFLDDRKLGWFTIGGPMIVTFYAFWQQTSGRMIAIRKLIEVLEKTGHGVRLRSGNLTQPLQELPH